MRTILFPLIAALLSAWAHAGSDFESDPELMEGYFRYQTGTCAERLKDLREAKYVCTDFCAVDEDDNQTCTENTEHKPPTNADGTPYCPKNPWTGQCVTE